MRGTEHRRRTGKAPVDTTAAPDDAPAASPAPDAGPGGVRRAPARRPAGVAPRVQRTADTPTRFAAAARYPAMFHVAGGRLVWDGTRLAHVRGDSTPTPTAGRPVVTVSGTAISGTASAGPTVVVTWPTPAGDAARPAASARPSRVVLLDRSAERFVRFARALQAARPGALVLDDRTTPSARVPRLRPGTPGSERRPGVFVRAVWRAWTASGEGSGPGASGGADLVDRLERLAALHRDGALTGAEYARAKARLLG
jgi:hypothetical protein